MPIFLIAAFFVCIMLGILLLGAWLTRETNTGEIQASIVPAQAERTKAKDIFEETVTRVGQAVPAGEKATKTVQMLRFAGYRSANALATFMGIKATAACVLALIVGILWTGANADIPNLLTGVLAAIGIGYLLPHRILDLQVKRRCYRLRTGLPVAIDLLVLGLEAGQSLDAAITEAGRELRDGFPDIAQELAWVQMEMFASKSRSEAFRNLSERNAEPEMKRSQSIRT